MPKKKDEPNRGKTWACLVYPDSAPEGWQATLAGLLIETYVSPLHDQDVLDNGSAKKPHYHVMFCFTAPKSDEQFRKIAQQIGGVGAELIHNTVGMGRYLCHLDNPEKAQYLPSAVRCFCGGDYDRFLVNKVDRMAVLKEITAFIRENGIVTFCDLVDYAAEERADWFKVLSDSRSFVLDYIKSFAWKVSGA